MGGIIKMGGRASEADSGTPRATFFSPVDKLDNRVFRREGASEPDRRTPCANYFSPVDNCEHRQLDLRDHRLAFRVPRAKLLAEQWNIDFVAMQKRPHSGTVPVGRSG